MSSVPNLSNFVESQTKFLNDELILVDEEDNPVGSITKLNGHLLSNKNKYPHRAFSIFYSTQKIDYLYKNVLRKKLLFQCYGQIHVAVIH